MKPLLLVAALFGVAVVSHEAGKASARANPEPQTQAEAQAENYRVLQRLDTFELLGVAIEGLGEMEMDPEDMQAECDSAIGAYISEVRASK